MILAACMVMALALPVNGLERVSVTAAGSARYRSVVRKSSAAPAVAASASDRQRPENVVMGLAAYTENFMRSRYFVHSLRQAHYTGAIVLGVAKGLPAKERSWLEQHQVTAHEVGVTRCRAIPKMWCDAADDRVPMALARFMWYSTWLEKGGYTGYVMVADVKDIFFQSDPFATLQIDPSRPYVQVAREFGYDDAAEVAADTGRMQGSTIARSGFTRGWIKNCLGDEAARRVQQFPVLCSGSTLGTRLGMERYLRMMNKTIHEQLATGLADCYAVGVDQGFHNFLLHTKVLERAADLEIDSPENGSPSQIQATIGTMCTVPPTMKGLVKVTHSWDKVLRRDKEGFVIRSDGSRAPLVHQYNRCINQFKSNGWIEQHFVKSPSV
jgi:hypothetical protein